MSIDIRNTVNTVVVTPDNAEYLWLKFPNIPVVSFKDPLEIILDNRLFFSNETIEKADWLTLPILKELAHLKVKGELKFEYTNANYSARWGYTFDGLGHYKCINKKPDFQTLLSDTRYVYDKKELLLSSLHGTEIDVINQIKYQVKKVAKEYPDSKDIQFSPDNKGITPKVYIYFQRPENELEKKTRIQHEQHDALSKLPARERNLRLIELHEQSSEHIKHELDDFQESNIDDFQGKPKSECLDEFQEATLSEFEYR